MMDTYDLAVIASGPAGERAAEVPEFGSDRKNAAWENGHDYGRFSDSRRRVHCIGVMTSEIVGIGQMEISPQSRIANM